jgi:hypothetical protein
MKCSKCGFEGDDDKFTYNLCIFCIKAEERIKAIISQSKPVEEDKKTYSQKYYQKYYAKNRYVILERNRKNAKTEKWKAYIQKYQQDNIEHLREYRREYYRNYYRQKKLEKQLKLSPLSDIPDNP